MGNERRFSAINTKIRVMRSQFLKDDDYIALMEMNSIEDQIRYLREETKYSEVLKEINDSDDIQQVELQLERLQISQFEKIITYFSDEYERYFRSFMFRYETEDLKLFLRVLARGEKLENYGIESLLKDKYYSFSYEKVKDAKSVVDFIDKLKGTKFYDVLYPYRNENHSKLMFYMEMNLDRLYFNTISDSAQKLSKPDRDAFNEVFGENIDILNIEWIYRGLRFYNLAPEELINYTLPHGLVFHFKELKDLCYGDVEHLKVVVSKTNYKELVNEDKNIDLFMGLRVQRYMYQSFKTAFREGKFDISISNAYLHLLEYEIKDIISIIEAKKYGLSYYEAREYLVREIKGSDE
jgi:V/A-type H+-transporting ATPase subunit C